LHRSGQVVALAEIVAPHARHEVILVMTLSQFFSQSPQSIDLDRIESHLYCRQLIAKSIEQCVFRRPIVRKNHAAF
jgi:hypothetical protein